MILAEARVRAQRGYVLLDEKGPDDWKERIDPLTLDMNNTYNCILGQVYADFWRGTETLEMTHDETVHYGFNAQSFGAEYALLKLAWLELLGYATDGSEKNKEAALCALTETSQWITGPMRK